jgi:hypothetical protein
MFGVVAEWFAAKLLKLLAQLIAHHKIQSALHYHCKLHTRQFNGSATKKARWLDFTDAAQQIEDVVREFIYRHFASRNFRRAVMYDIFLTRESLINSEFFN